jgi:hypothetical protein
VAKVVAAFGLRELVKKLTAETPEAGHGSFRSAANQPLELGKHQFDGIHVRTVRRQVNESCACCFDGLPHPGYFVGGQVVHHDNVAIQQRWRELLSHVPEEHLPIDRSIYNQRSRQAGSSQSSQERCRFPMSVRHGLDNTLTSRRSTPQSREIGFHPRFVEKNESLWVEPRLLDAPRRPTRGDVWPILLRRPQDLF